jgi:transformer-2 protein
VYFEEVSAAEAAREAMNGADIDGKMVRVDFSTTKRAHSPTPGFYAGQPYVF